MTVRGFRQVITRRTSCACVSVSRSAHRTAGDQRLNDNGDALREVIPMPIRGVWRRSFDMWRDDNARFLGYDRRIVHIARGFLT